MSIFSNVTEQDLINLRKLAEQQKNQRDLENRSRILKQTHDIKLAESLSPITKNLDEVKEPTQNLGEVFEKSQPETPQLAIGNTVNHQPIENFEVVVYDVELENTLKNMTGNAGFFKTYYDCERGWMWNGYPIKMSSGTEVEIKVEKFIITPGIQKVLTHTSNIPLKNLNDKDKEIFINNSESLDFEKYKAIPGESKSSRYQQSKTNFQKHNLKGQGIKKIIIPSNIIDIYTRLEILLGPTLSGHTDTLTQASNLFDELYKRGEIQNKQKYRNAPNKLHI